MDECAGQFGMEKGRCGDTVAVPASVLPGASLFLQVSPDLSQHRKGWGG